MAAAMRTVLVSLLIAPLLIVLSASDVIYAGLQRRRRIAALAHDCLVARKRAPALDQCAVGSNYRCGQAALCSGGILANASGEQSMLAEGMASLLMMPPLPGITCVPPSILSSWCGVAAHAETVKTKTIPPSHVLALFMPRCRTRVRMFLPPSTQRSPRCRAVQSFYASAVLPTMIQIKWPCCVRFFAALAGRRFCPAGGRAQGRPALRLRLAASGSER